MSTHLNTQEEDDTSTISPRSYSKKNQPFKKKNGRAKPFKRIYLVSHQYREAISLQVRLWKLEGHLLASQLLVHGGEGVQLVFDVGLLVLVQMNLEESVCQ